ncbi:MAG: divalent metal cation transporter [Hyphomicrobiales bacterium]|nr:divalent metal cation transporter [Hyphomicrobiales bacterium]
MALTENGVAAEGSPVVEKSKPRLFRILGPGLITGASDDDPGGIATYSQTGAQLGYAASWTLLFSYPLMTAIQIVSARLGRTTGKGIAGNVAKHYSPLFLYGAVGLLLLANVINIGADIGAMADSLRLLIGGPQLIYVVVFGIIAVLMQVFLAYKRYVGVLKFLTLALFAYIGTLFFVHVDWPALTTSLLVPHLSFDKDYLTGIVAIFGTTISPYLFFWQSSQEVEDIKAKPEREPLLRAPEQAPEAHARISLDTAVGMAFSNIIALAIMVAAAATLNASGKTDITSSAQAAEALRPLAGSTATFLFAAGIVGTGLLAVPVLGGSAAYAVGEALKWKVGLDRKPREARAFYGTIAAATLIGAALNLTPINPIQALFWSAVINGVVAVPIMALMMVMASQRAIMADQAIGGSVKLLGWIATLLMAGTAFAMLASMAF